MDKGFPWEDYLQVTREAIAIIKDRDEKGRNEETSFYAGFPHGSRDVSFELKRRVARILGAERRGMLTVARGDAIDLLNYAAFYVMMLDREMNVPVGEASARIETFPGDATDVPSRLGATPWTGLRTS
ncbi:hypothetical protein [Nitrospira sp. BLG_1]|uniref:hypothetical protein n=1 Tax=Nitrospira sp. BLG_1 TaxID=3395883 RepID=UPI0039BD7F5F